METKHQIALFYPDTIEGTELTRRLIVEEKDKEEIEELLKYIKARGTKHYKIVRRLVTYSEWETLDEQ